MRIALAASALVLAAACASTAPAPEAPATPVAPVAPVVDDTPSGADLAMKTAANLYAAGNAPIAIDRLTQELGNPDLSVGEKATLYMLRADMRYGKGNDLFGAVSDYEAVIGLLPGSALAGEAQASLDLARGEATSLNFLLEAGELARSERFETLYRLGRHDEAVDMLMQGGVTAQPGSLLGLYQTGYLCEGESYTGPAFDIVEPDGTARTVRFCDFGK